MHRLKSTSSKRWILIEIWWKSSLILILLVSYYLICSPSAPLLNRSISWTFGSNSPRASGVAQTRNIELTRRNRIWDKRNNFEKVIVEGQNRILKGFLFLRPIFCIKANNVGMKLCNTISILKLLLGSTDYC